MRRPIWLWIVVAIYIITLSLYAFVIYQILLGGSTETFD